MKQMGLFLGSMALGGVILAFAVASSREKSEPAGSRAGLWLSYLIGLFLVVQGVVGLVRLR